MNATKVNWEKMSVLIVEDETELRNILCLFFKRKKAKVFSAENGEAALAIAAKEKIHFVLSDVRMPSTDGIWLLDELRKRNPDIPVVFLATGFADLNEADAKARGALGLIQKPFSVTTLFSVLDEALSRHPSIPMSA